MSLVETSHMIYALTKEELTVTAAGCRQDISWNRVCRGSFIFMALLANL